MRFPLHSLHTHQLSLFSKCPFSLTEERKVEGDFKGLSRTQSGEDFKVIVTVSSLIFFQFSFFLTLALASPRSSLPSPIWNISFCCSELKAS